MYECRGENGYGNFQSTERYFHIRGTVFDYIIIGYMMNGKPIATTAANNQRDVDALNTSLQKFIMDSYCRHNHPPGSFE